MRAYFFKTLCIALLLYSSASGQTLAIQWKKAVVKIESIQQHYTEVQVNAMLQKKLGSIGHVISQHETFDIRSVFADQNDTIRGTGIMIADGAKIYLVTVKHIIKATDNPGNGLETVTDLLSIRTDAVDKKTNDITLLNLIPMNPANNPFIFSDNKTDLGIISFQKNSYKEIVAYMKQNGVVPISLSAILLTDDDKAGDDISTVGFPAIHDSEKSEAINGKIAAITKSTPDFIVNLAVRPGNSGGPVIKNNKLVGILSYQTGIANNNDAAMHPFAQAGSAAATKASYILPLLRKLQLNEKKPGFNK